MTKNDENKNIETYVLTKKELEQMIDEDEELATMLKDAKDTYNRKIDSIKRKLLIGMSACVLGVAALGYCTNQCTSYKPIESKSIITPTDIPADTTYSDSLNQLILTRDIDKDGSVDVKKIVGNHFPVYVVKVKKEFQDYLNNESTVNSHVLLVDSIE